MSEPVRPFDFPHFRAAVFAAFVTQNWDAVGNALALIQAATGDTVLGGDPSPEQVLAWATALNAMAARDAKVVDETGDLPERLQCNSPDCGTHRHAVRARIAKRHAATLQATPPPGEEPVQQVASEPTTPARGTVPLIWGRPVPGIQ